MIARLTALAVVAIGCGRSNFDLDASDAVAGDTPAALVNNIAFVTSTTQLPLTYGADAAGGDAVCNARAAAAGLPGTYVAFLSTATVDARERLGTARGWVRVDGKPFLDRVTDLGAGAVLHPLSIDEHGGDVGTAAVHTASDSAGVEDGNSCSNFSNAAGFIQVGTTAGTRTEWVASGSKGCTESARLYCFGIDTAAPLQFTPATGRHMFLSTQEFVVDGSGISKADALCNSEAILAGLSGTYVALLATTTASALSRLTLAGPTWVRPDGVALVVSPLDLGAPKLATTPNVTASKAYVVGYANTGSTAPTAASSDINSNCSNWTVPVGTALAGSVGLTDQFFTVGAGNDCSERVYCFEQ